MEGQDGHVRKKVEHAIPRKKAHVTGELESLCESMQFKRLPDELNGDEQAHQCAQSDLDSGYSNFDPQRGNGLEHAD